MRIPVRSRSVYSLGVLFVATLCASVITWLPGHVVTRANAQPSENLATAIVQVAKTNIPAVVHITVTERTEVQNPLWPFEKDPLFKRFFNMPKMPKKFQKEVQGLGSGVLMDASGHILTNNHVAGGATKIEVVLSDGSQYPAKVVGTDPQSDLAVIQIDAKRSLPYARFGDSDKLEVGEWVVAIGAPRGLYNTVTQGIISAKHRAGIVEPSNYQDFLQTDAPINPGNSGGPLLNLRGEVIGVNAAIATESGGFEGIGFAIPSNMATWVAKELIAHGKVTRGWLGVSIQDLTPELAQKFHVPNLQGALVAQVVKDGPAEKAGLRRGDVIMSYNGKPVSDSSQLRNEVAGTGVGEEANVTVLRDGKQESFRVRIGNLAESQKTLETSLKDRLGVEVRPLNDKEAQQYGIDQNQGVVISSLDPNGAFAKAGLEKDDVIMGIDNQQVTGVDSLVQMVTALPPNHRATILVLDHRSGNTGSVLVRIP